MKKPILLAILILSIIGLIFSVLILILHQNNAALHGICTIDGSDSCLIVQESAYSRMFGVDNSYFGIAGFLALTILSFISLIKRYKLVNYALIIGCILSGLFALWFLFAQIFLIRAFCIYCLVVDIASFVLMGIVLTHAGKKNSTVLPQK
ncbi:MAG: vitamin K epoxide reductase family protein [Nanoarchaeota archaeon]